MPVYKRDEMIAIPGKALRIWDWLSHLGVGGETHSAARRVVLTNRVWLLSGLTMVVHGVHVALFDLAGMWPLELIVLSGLVMMSAALLSNARGHHLVPRLMFAFAAPALVGWTLFWGGRSLGTDLYLFGTWTALFLVVSRRDLWLLAAGGLAYALIFVLSRDESFSVPNARFSIQPEFIGQTEWVCRVQAIWFITAVLLMFYLEIGKTQLQLESKTRLAEKERERSDRLLENLMPFQVLRRLKHKPGTIADHIPQATIMFCDLVGFTELCQHAAPARVVNVLDEVFSHFDRIITDHGLEKIKTIGDAYMAAGGLNGGGPQAEAAANAAMDMRDCMRRLTFNGDGQFQVHIGIHSGPVVAGVIGTARASYDLWGHTVNIASRLQHVCRPGDILVSDATHTLIAERFAFATHDDVTISGVGDVRAWSLMGRKFGSARIPMSTPHVERPRAKAQG